MSGAQSMLLACLPQWNPTHPQLALPMLAGYLGRQEIPVRVRDFNIAFYDWLLDGARLAELFAPVATELRTLEAAAAGDDAAHARYLRLLPDALSFDTVLAQIERAKTYLRVPPGGHYHLEDYVHARALVETSLRLATLASGGRLHFTWDGLTLIGGDRVSTGLEQIEGSILHRFVEEHVMPVLIAEGSDILGLSVSTPAQFLLALLVARRYKTRRPDGVIVVGGSLLPSLVPLLRACEEVHRFVDAYALYEGERTLAQFPGVLAGDHRLDDVPNLIFRRDGVLVETPIVDPPPLDEVGIPDFSQLPLDRYFAPKPILPFLDYRGCDWRRCAFCTHHRSYSARGAWRDLEKLSDGLAELSRRHHTDAFYFVSESIHVPMMRRLADVLAQGGPRIRWFASARFEAPLARSETAEALARSGCRMLIFGLESGHQRVLDAMGKGTNVEQMQAVLANLRAHGILTSTMQFLGFPSETREEAEATLEFLARNHSTINIGATRLGLFRLNEESLVAAHPERYGVVDFASDRMTDTLIAELRYRTTSGMTPAEAAQMVREFEERQRTTIDFVFLIRDRAHALFVGPHGEGDWDSQLFSSAALPADRRLAGAGLDELQPRLAPGAVVAVVGAAPGQPALLLHNLWTHRSFLADRWLLDLLRMLDVAGSFEELARLVPNRAWVTDALAFLRSESFLGLNGTFRWDGAESPTPCPEEPTRGAR